MISKKFDSSKDKKLSASFINDVESGNIQRVRIDLLSAITMDGVDDGSYKRFDMMERYASERIKSLYDKHEDATTDKYGFKPMGGELISDKSKWDRDYVYAVYNYALEYNFSRERIKYLKKVVRYAYMSDIILGRIYIDIKSKYDITMNFNSLYSYSKSSSLKEFILNKDNKEEFKKLVMEEIKKQLESSKNESIYNDIINGSYFNEIDYV